MGRARWNRILAPLVALAVGVLPLAAAWAQGAPRMERGDFHVERDEVLRGNLVVEEGDLTVDGEVDGWVVVADGNAIIRGTVLGDVVAVYGDVIVMGDGLIQGDAVSVSGDVVLRDSGVVTGSNITTTRRGLDRQGDDVAWARIVRRSGVLSGERGGRGAVEERRTDWWEAEWNRDRYRSRYYRFLYDGSFPLGGLVYNRVDGWTIQGELFDSEFFWRTTGTSFYGGAGYAFASKRFYYRLGLNRYWFPRAPVEVGASVYRQLETEDTWYMTPNENDWMAALARYDWYDYFLNEGFQVHVKITPTPWLSVGARYAQEHENAVENATDWALFGGKRTFRDNTWYDPGFGDFVAADEGEIRRTVYFLNFGDGSGRRVRPSRGFRVDGWWEKVGENGLNDGGDFVYERMLLELQAYLSLSPIDHFALRVRAGSTSDPITDVPVQHRFYLGGVGSLRGYDFKQYVGNRLFLATLEYAIGTGGWSPIFDDWTIRLFYDYGLAWTADPGTDLWDDLWTDEGKRAAGIGVSPFGWDEFRVEIVRPLDREDGDDEFVYYFRWSFDF